MTHLTRIEFAWGLDPTIDKRQTNLTGSFKVSLIANTGEYLARIIVDQKWTILKLAIIALTVRASMTYTAEMLRVSTLGSDKWSKSPLFKDINSSLLFVLYSWFFIGEIHITMMMLPLIIISVGTAEIVYHCVILFVR